jgi:AraC-like DNA-binding protein
VQYTVLSVAGLNKTLIEIALQSGFRDQAARSRTFTRVEHMTPSRWRRLNSNRTGAHGGTSFQSVLTD